MTGPANAADFAATGPTAEFLAAYPAYANTARLDALRASEYGYLDRDGHVYLDYAGAGLPAQAQLDAHRDRLASGCYGNPHSENPTSRAAGELVESARRAVLAYLNADPERYTVIFTPNATGACRLVGEAYPFRRGRRLVLTVDNHNSVIGIREHARVRHATIRYVPVTAPELRVAERAVRDALSAGGWWRRGEARRGLFGYPAQSNFSGVRHPLEWVELAHRHGYDVLLDAAAYLPTNPLDLAVVQPEFVAVSWYKLFGYPTGLGCLVARRDALARLRRPWFAGGTVAAVSVQGDWHRLTDDESAFEDGTLNFLSIPDIEVGLSWLETVGLDAVRCRVECLTGWLLDRLRSLRHGSGAPMVRIYGPADTRDRGGTVAFNFLDPAGEVVDERLVAREFADRGVSLRTGCFCNPGAGEGAFAVATGSVRRSMGRARTVDDYLTLIGVPSGGAVRVSLGLASTVADVERFLAIAESTYRDRPAPTTALAPRTRC
jgi:selenocysteine lyase/cysteine desulfurase